MRYFVTALLFLCVSLQSQEVRLKMHILGWSEEGLFCWKEDVTKNGQTEEFIHVVDLVTDTSVYSQPYLGESSRAQVYAQYKINSDDKGRATGGNRLVWKGKLFETDLFVESDRVAIRLKNGTDGTVKEVNTTLLGGDEMEIKGSVISPYEDRVALVFLRKGVESAGYVVMGAHLKLGFSPIPVDDEGLIESVLNGQYYICRLILSEGKHPDSEKDSRGYTPLLLAVRNEKWQIASLLLSFGANASVPDKEGKTPLQYAREAGQTALIQQIEQE